MGGKRKRKSNRRTNCSKPLGNQEPHPPQVSCDGNTLAIARRGCELTRSLVNRKPVPPPLSSMLEMIARETSNPWTHGPPYSMLKRTRSIESLHEVPHRTSINIELLGRRGAMGGQEAASLDISLHRRTPELATLDADHPYDETGAMADM